YWSLIVCTGSCPGRPATRGGILREANARPGRRYCMERSRVCYLAARRTRAQAMRPFHRARWKPARPRRKITASCARSAMAAHELRRFRVEDGVALGAKGRALLCFRDKGVPGAIGQLVRLEGRGFGRRVAVVEAQGAKVFRKGAVLAPAEEQGIEPQLAGG